MANLGRIIGWVRDRDPEAADPPSAGADLDRDTVAAFTGFSDEWAETLAAVQVCTAQRMLLRCKVVGALMSGSFCAASSPYVALGWIKVCKRDVVPARLGSYFVHFVQRDAFLAPNPCQPLHTVLRAS